MRIAHVPARRAALHGIRLSHPAIMQGPRRPVNTTACAIAHTCTRHPAHAHSLKIDMCRVSCTLITPAHSVLFKAVGVERIADGSTAM